MEDERIEEMTKTQQETPVVEERLRTPMTILFSDIKDSTAYFERNGDVEGLAMVERHNNLLFPCVENNSGRIIKTIGDAIMAMFLDPVDAVTAAARMQLALEEENSGREVSEEIHVKIGVHTGLGLTMGNDVFGDVVNAAARVQGQAQPDQILITDSLLSAAHTAGYQAGKLGRAKMKGKAEPIDIYAVGWSPRATQQVIDDLQERSAKQLQEFEDAKAKREEDFDRLRAEWGDDRRNLNAEIERLEESAQGAMESARQQIGGELQKQGQFKIEAANKARAQVEENLKSTQERFEVERVGYKTQIARLENRLVESMEQVNNPARTANLVREQVQSRLAVAKKEWQAQWDAERKRLTEGIAKAKTAGPQDPMAEARRLMMERIKAKQEGKESGQGGEDKASIASKEKLERERDELRSRIQLMEKETERAEADLRAEVSNQFRHTFDQKMEQATHTRTQLEQELRTLTEELAGEKQAAASRIQHLEEAIPVAEEAAKVQAIAEARADFEAKLEEADRVASRLQRQNRETVEEWNLERAQLEKQVKELESNVKQAREMAFKRSSDPTVEELNRLRRQLEEEFKTKAAVWDEEKRHLSEKIQNLENPSIDE